MTKKFCDKCGKEIWGPSPNLPKTNSFKINIKEIAWNYTNNHEFDFCSECGLKAASILQKFKNEGK